MKFYKDCFTYFIQINQTYVLLENNGVKAIFFFLPETGNRKVLIICYLHMKKSQYMFICVMGYMTQSVWVI